MRLRKKKDTTRPRQTVVMLCYLEEILPPGSDCHQQHQHPCHAKRFSTVKIWFVLRAYFVWSLSWYQFQASSSIYVSKYFQKKKWPIITAYPLQIMWSLCVSAALVHKVADYRKKTQPASPSIQETWVAMELCFFFLLRGCQYRPTCLMMMMLAYLFYIYI